MQPTSTTVTLIKAGTTAATKTLETEGELATVGKSASVGTPATSGTLATVGIPWKE